MNEEHTYDAICKVNGRGVYVSKALSKEVGSFTTTGFMAQLIYVAEDLEKKAGELFYKTVDEIYNETGITRWEQETAKKALVKKGWITIMRKGVPPKNHFTITHEFTRWCAGAVKQEKDSKRGKTSIQSEDDVSKGGFTSNQSAVKPPFKTRENSGILHKQQHKQQTKRTSLSKGVAFDSVKDVLFEAEECLPKNEINGDQFIGLWNQSAIKFYFTQHRKFNSEWLKNLKKANATINDYGTGGWTEFFKCVNDIMCRYQGTEYVRYFTAGFALRPEKFQSIMEDNVRFPIKYDKQAVKKIIEGLKEKRMTLAKVIQRCEREGTPCEKKVDRWKGYGTMINKWETILTGITG